MISIFEKYCTIFGYPERIRTDNGPQYRSDFDEFCKQKAIIHENSSPHFPQSNGLAESCVKNMKFLMKKCKENLKEFNFRLLEWRNTPNQSGRSPAQIFLGRRLRTQLPTLSGSTDLDLANALQGGKNRKEILKSMETTPKTKLSLLNIGQRVMVQHPTSKRWDSKATIISMRNNKRSYLVKQDDGRTWIRNRKFLRPISNNVNENDTLKRHNPSQDSDPQPKNFQPRRSKRIKGKSK